MTQKIDFEEVIQKYKNFIFIVEGKKDSKALRYLGLNRVYELNEVGTSLSQRIENIIENIDKKDVVCILTDLDKKGRHLYLIIQKEMQSKGIHLDSSFRNLLLRLNISHIEGLYSYVMNHRD